LRCEKPPICDRIPCTKEEAEEALEDPEGQQRERDPPPDAVTHDGAKDGSADHEWRREHGPPHREVLETSRPVIERELNPNRQIGDAGEDQDRTIEPPPVPGSHPAGA
jgi:hypothetical protein